MLFYLGVIIVQPISERVTNDKNPSTFYDKMSDNISNDIRVACIGIIQAFNPTPGEQTVTVQPAIRERIKDQYGNFSYVNLPLLVDVPVQWPRGGGFLLTFPINPGDECELSFCDSCIDAWWSNGGVQNPMEQRRHDISDAVAKVGITSQHNPIGNYNMSAVELRNEAGTVKLSLSASGVNITGGLTVDGVAFAPHYHLAPAGGGNTGGAL